MSWEPLFAARCGTMSAAERRCPVNAPSGTRPEGPGRRKDASRRWRKQLQPAPARHGADAGAEPVLQHANADLGGHLADIEGVQGVPVAATRWYTKSSLGIVRPPESISAGPEVQAFEHRASRGAAGLDHPFGGDVHGIRHTDSCVYRINDSRPLLSCPLFSSVKRPFARRRPRQAGFHHHGGDFAEETLLSALGPTCPQGGEPGILLRVVSLGLFAPLQVVGHVVCRGDQGYQPGRILGQGGLVVEAHGLDQHARQLAVLPEPALQGCGGLRSMPMAARSRSSSPLSSRKSIGSARPKHSGSASSSRMRPTSCSRPAENSPPSNLRR